VPRLTRRGAFGANYSSDFRRDEHRARKARFDREQTKGWRGATDGSPQAELDFKFYRQATNKIGGISEVAGKFLRKYFLPGISHRARSVQAIRLASG